MTKTIAITAIVLVAVIMGISSVAPAISVPSGCPDNFLIV